MVDGSGPIGDAFRACHACTVSAAVKVTVRPDAVADHLYAAILTRGREGVNRTLETVEGARLIPGILTWKALEFSTPPTNALTFTVVAVKR